MSPSIEIYKDLYHDNNSLTRWRDLFENSNFKENDFDIDKSNLLYCFNIFLKALKNCDNVSFGYEHDSILYSIEDFSDIDLINIDHHDDVFAGDFVHDYEYEIALKKEYDAIVKDDRVHEGNWIAWLVSKKKINSYVWIGNKNSSNKDRNFFNEKIVPNYLNVEKENYKFSDYNFDHIFICLSPQYIPKNYWYYFSMFVDSYEQFTEKDAIIKSNKYEVELRDSKIRDEILYQCTNGR